MEWVWGEGGGKLKPIASEVVFPYEMSYRGYQFQKVLGWILWAMPGVWVGMLGFVVYRTRQRWLKFVKVIGWRVGRQGLSLFQSSWGVGLILAVGVVVFFYDVVFLGRTLLATNTVPSTVPSGAYNYQGHRVENIYVMDPFASAWIHEPTTHLTSLLYHRGIIPLWNPHSALGTPLNADMISTVFFPLSWLLYLNPSAAMWDFYLLLRIFLAGVFMYQFLRHHEHLDPLSCGIGSIGYMFCGHLMLHLNIVFIHAAMLLPALMYTTEKLYREPGMRGVVWNGGMVGLLLLGGHPEPSFFALFFATGYYGMRCLFMEGERRKGKGERAKGKGERGSLLSPFAFRLSPFAFTFRFVVRRVVYLVGSYGLGLLISGIMVVPFVEFVEQSYLGRHDPGLTQVGLWHLPARDLILLIFPYFFGPIHQSWSGVEWGFQPGYVGMGMILLVVLASLEGVGFQRRYVFYTLMIVFFIVKGYGLSSSINQLLGQLPFFEVSHFTRYFPPEFMFSVVVLMSGELSRIGQGQYRSGWLVAVILLSWVLIGVLWKTQYSQLVMANKVTEAFWQTMPTLVLGGMILLGLWLTSRTGRSGSKLLSHRGLVALIGAGLTGELFILLPHDHMDRYEPFVEPPFVKFLKSEPGTFRVYGLDGYLFPNTANAYELNDIGFVNGLVSKRFWTLSASLINPALHANWFFTGNEEIRNVDNRFFNLFNLKYVIIDRQGAPPHFRMESNMY
ncbi:MAG: hypothetical protein L0Y56_03290, partial [Nitrospira sp.]|nr:hypothetical protein [Nitrospira sp.]